MSKSTPGIKEALIEYLESVINKTLTKVQVAKIEKLFEENSQTNTMNTEIKSAEEIFNDSYCKRLQDMILDNKNKRHPYLKCLFISAMDEYASQFKQHGYTQEQIRQAGKDGEISSIDVEHLINILAEKELLPHLSESTANWDKVGDIDKFMEEVRGDEVPVDNEDELWDKIIRRCGSCWEDDNEFSRNDLKQELKNQFNISRKLYE